ncbi:MAG: LysM peptidoglycan-binding domain-containing protein [Acidobacteria bacterium]|nr:LysM peptidoglycan-binding domain-containing protein [Acidobacteriota bacterium]
MEKITRQWVLLVLCSACFACAPDAGKLSQVNPPPAPQPNFSQVSGLPEAAQSAAAQDQSQQAQPAALPASEQESFATEAPAQDPSPRGVPRRHEVYPPADEPVFDPPSSTIAHLAGEAPEIAMEALPAVEDELALIDELNDVAIPDDFDLEAFRQERLKNTESELPLVLNSQVVKFINYFTGSRGKKTVINTLERAGAFRGLIEKILEEEGVPGEIFHLAQAESGFRPKARSRVHATGMWQFMKFRGRQYGLRQDKYVDERYDPEKATRAAARHLLDLYIEFGDWYLAMAAYNGGPNRIKRAVERTNSTDFWEHSRRRFLRRETSNYVPIILAMAYVGKNLDMYGIEIKDPAPPLEYDTIETDSEIHLDLIADLADTTAETIKQLNPALLRSATPPYSYDLRLPTGSGETFLSRLEAIPSDKRLAWRRHQVKEGESLAVVAKRYRVNESQILAHNPIEEDKLGSGDWLTIPAPPARLSYYGSSGGGGAGGLLESGTGRYRVARGDNLGSISSRFGVSIANLRQWNGLSSSRIVAGRYLIVKPEGVGKEAEGKQATQASSLSSTPPPNSRTYRIRSGDTLGTIARRHGISVAQLKAWNGLRSNRIRAGAQLVVGKRVEPSTTAAKSSGTASRALTPPVATGDGSGKYRIRRGDNLATIAKRFGVTLADLKEWNRLRSTRIGAGDYLIVRPPSQTVASASPRAVSSSAPPVNGSAQEYRIQRGDNLAGIAQRFGVDVDDLKQWNDLRGTRITAGETLKLSPAAGREASPRPIMASAGANRYQIQRGDTLAVIAKRFGVSVRDLMAWNGLNNSRIQEGRYLTVSPSRGGDGGS